MANVIKSGLLFIIELMRQTTTTKKFDINSEDLANIITELLTQVYQFSRLYWKSLRQQNVPVTIKYPEMVAQIAPLFQGTIHKESKDKLWFL